VATPDEIALWILGEVMRHGEVAQKSIVLDIEMRFGAAFVPANRNGNPSVRKDVLSVFRKISNDSVVWMGSKKGL
jgi:hypothetical protein